MLPIKDENPHFLTPWVSWGTIAANVLCWIWIQDLGREPWLTRSVCELGLIPGELMQRLPAGELVPMGSAICVLQGHSPWYTPLSSMFLHAGWFHLIGNMWFLWIFGNSVEDSMGHLRFGVFYVLCGLAAAATQVVTQPASPLPMVGASGAIGGVMGAYVVLYPRVRVHLMLWIGFYVTRAVVPAYFMLGYWFLLQLMGGVFTLGRGGGGGVAFWAHVGGFGAGALLAAVFRKPALVRRHPGYGWR